MLQLYQLQDKIEGFLYRHFTYGDLLEIADRHGIIVIEKQPFHDELKDMPAIGCNIDGTFFILISDRVDNPNKRWYYLGHELGHYFLHNGICAFYRINLNAKKISGQHTKYKEIMEAEANLFAKFSFLPLEYVREKFEKRFIFDDAECPDIVDDIVQYTLGKLDQSRLPKDMVRLTRLVHCILDSYLIVLGLKNVLYAQNGHLKHIIELVREVDMWQTPGDLKIKETVQ